MSESINNDSDFMDINNSKKNSLFSKSIKKLIIVGKKNRKYFFPKFSHYTKADKIIEGFILFFSFCSYILYYLSLGGCDGTQTECLKNSNIAYYYLLVNYCFISAGIIALIIFLIILRRITKLHLIHIIIIFFCLFMYDRGSTLMHHGIYNIFGFLTFFIFYCLFLFLVIKIQDILTKKSLPHKLVVINIIILIIIFGRYAFHESLKKECKDWDLGLNNTRIEDDINKYPCQIFRPISCHITYFNNKQDLSRLLKLDCSNDINSNQAINSRNQLIKYINKKEFENTTKFGFPLTNRPKFIIDAETTPDIFTRKVYDNIIDMDNKSIIIPPEEYPEVTLTFEEKEVDKNKKDNSIKYIGKININLTRNEALSASRKQIENPNSLFNNIIMIYTDAVSRAHFQRKMPKTTAFIENLMKNNFENNYIDFKNEISNINKVSITNNINNALNKNENIVLKEKKMNILNKINKNTNILQRNQTFDITKNNTITTANINITTYLSKNTNIISDTNITKINSNIAININKKANINNPKRLNSYLSKKQNENLKREKNNLKIKLKLISNRYLKNQEKSKISRKIKNNKLSNKRNNKDHYTKYSILEEGMKQKNIAKKNNLGKKYLNQELKMKSIKNKNFINKDKKEIFQTQLNNKKINIKNKQTIRKLETINITNYFENKYYAYQFLKYHTFNSGTKFNAMPMFYGTTVYNSHGTNIIQYFKQLGFITAQATDMCSKEVWEPEKEPELLNFDLWDHENVAMFCDPSYMDRKSLYSIYKGVYSLLRRCFYAKEVHDYIFEYGKQFWEAYPNNKKFLRLGFNDGHESTFEVLKYLDEPMADFLQFFLEKGYLKNTALFIVSDHGNHMPGIYNLFFSEQFETERVLANFYLIINIADSLGDKIEMFREFNLNAMENQQSLITPYDIHDTMIHIMNGNNNLRNYSNKGKSVFKKIDNRERTCEFFDKDDEEKGLCRCVPNNKYEKFIYYDYKK